MRIRTALVTFAPRPAPPHARHGGGQRLPRRPAGCAARRLLGVGGAPHAGEPAVQAQEDDDGGLEAEELPEEVVEVLNKVNLKVEHFDINKSLMLMTLLRLKNRRSTSSSRR